MKALTNKDRLALKLKRIKEISTNEEWLVFVLAYYEKLTIKEIALIINKDILQVNSLIDAVLMKAVPILGDSVNLL